MDALEAVEGIIEIIVHQPSFPRVRGVQLPCGGCGHACGGRVMRKPAHGHVHNNPDTRRTHAPPFLVIHRSCIWHTHASLAHPRSCPCLQYNDGLSDMEMGALRIAGSLNIQVHHASCTYATWRHLDGSRSSQIRFLVLAAEPTPISVFGTKTCNTRLSHPFLLSLASLPMRKAASNHHEHAPTHSTTITWLTCKWML